ncbi:unnamed protein product [Lasius platythorax]|uniref:Uncharacterized protein n=1 Tax=Lasius platythorax TaxID=488582 RepID=A0AAV2P1U1_9HYME
MRGPLAPPRDAFPVRRESESRISASRSSHRRGQQDGDRHSRDSWCWCIPSKKRPSHAHVRVVAYPIMRCGPAIITCHENSVVLA